jgi:hypothetical protein
MLDIQTRLRLLTTATVTRDGHARRAIELLKNGKDREAMAAAKQAEKWDAKVKALSVR